MSQTLPITLQAVPVPVGVSAADINQLLTIIAQYMAASVQSDVTFIQDVTADPTQMTTLIIYNSTQQTFKQWNSTQGKYIAITQFQPGDTKSSFVAGDSPQTGWVVCDGRAISTLQGISQAQFGILQQLFGIGGNLPTVNLQNIVGLPTTSAYSLIPIPATRPPDGQISALPFSTDYTPAESQNLAANTETLRDSAAELRDAVAAINGVNNTLLLALKGGTSAQLYTSVFCGYP